MSYAIFRVEPINTLKDLGQIGSHNGRLKEAYKSNLDINKFKSNENIQIIDCNKNYYNSYMKLVKDYKEQHDKKQAVERENRKKTFNQMLDDSNSVVADELLFTSDKEFFKNMDKDEIIKWANTCMEFVYEDIGYNKNQILNAVIHLDEKTPHLHCVVVPLIKKYDKRSKEEKWTIFKKQYMKDRDYLSTLQDKYHSRMVKNGYDLDRGIKNSDNEHIDIKQYKQITRKLNLEITIKNEKLNNAMSDLENKMETNKETIFDKEFVKIKKDTFESMNKVINETKKVIELQPKIQKVYNEVDEYAKSYKYLEKENENIKREVEILKYKNNNLERENSRLNNYIESVLDAIKRFFRQILKIGNKEAKNDAVSEIKSFYNKEDFDKEDVYQVAKDTTKEYELFKYIDIDRYYEEEERNNDIEL